jgi:hypothetical protein
VCTANSGLYDSVSGDRVAAQQGPPGGLNVNVVNTPLSVTDTNASHQVPFAKLLCTNTFDIGQPCISGANGPTPALPSSFTVPTASGAVVKELVIEFVTANCFGTARTTEIFIDARPGIQTLQVADTGDNFSANKFPMSVAQFNDTLNQPADQAFAQQTKMTYVPGTVVSIAFGVQKPGSTQCAVQLNGHFVTR